MINRRSKFLYPLRVLVQVGRLPRYLDFFAQQNQEHFIKEQASNSKLESIHAELESIKKDLAALPNLDARLVNLQDKLERQSSAVQSASSATVVANNSVADNHDFDYFYKLFEDKFRGSEDVIKSRLIEHLELFQKLPDKLKTMHIVDIGCGRGEFLSLMKENHFRAVGIDINKSMVDRARSLGFEAEQKDALSYLKKQKTSSLAAITGFHIVEHIPFEALLKIFEQCYRTLSPGGFVLFETPNPQALTVGANTFYLDPSHQRPIPSGLLSFMLESVGFKPEVLPLHRVKPPLTSNNKALVDLYDAVYGPGDYAVVARKT